MCLPRTKWGDLHLAAPSYNLVTAPVTMQDSPPYLPFLVSRDWLVSKVGELTRGYNNQHTFTYEIHLPSESPPQYVGLEQV